MDCYKNNPEGDIIRFNPQCEIGYYDQELQLLKPEDGLMDSLRHYCGGPDSNLKSALIRAGFPYKDLDKKVQVLSGGEKARLMFLIIKLNQPNFLILDEPTNHIDIQGKEELEQQILETNATVLITSHDRRFVDNIADRYVLISGGALKEINRPEEFYSIAVPARGADLKRSTASNREAIKSDDNHDDILARIIELEERLEADLARKPKFQKPKLQAEWREELDELNGKL
jgi:ABC-type multidrug transport system ATPase subunit